MGADPVAPVGKNGIARSHLHDRDRACAQGHGQVGRVFVRVKAKAGDPLLCRACAHRLQHANGDHVLGLGQAGAQAHESIKFSIIVFGLPRLATGHTPIKKQGRVVDHGRRRDAFFQCGGIDERFETGAWLPPRLSDMVEFVLGKVKAADQGSDGACLRGQGHKSAFDFRQLGELPMALGQLNNSNHGTFAYAFGLWGFVRQA